MRKTVYHRRMLKLKPLVLTPLLSLCLAVSAAVAGPVDKSLPTVTPVPYDPLLHHEIDFETGALWRVGHNGTPLDYTILPQIITWKSPEAFGWNVGSGRLGFRHRISLLLEPIVEGPEDYYFGIAGSGTLEWWNAPRDFSLFFAAGGGVGWMDSKGYEVEGAQGQDLNFNWFLYSGARFMVAERCSVALGLYYQHVSNLDQDDVNPGIDALGPMLSFGWHF
ncbi:acyloxyacyl hydrolase [Roseimicrobium gellanilyticum]|nr:acyloxyacyl hydrolase [Roseimicrobium gellanilyticum]